MSKSTTALTNTQVKQSKPKENEYKLSDGDGLQLRIKPTGSRSWIFNYYKPYTKKRTTIGFGSYPEVSLSDARAKRGEARELLAKDIDPKNHKDKVALEKKEAIERTFGKYAQVWKIKKTIEVKEPTIRRAHQTLAKHVLPYIQKMPIGEIKPKYIITLLKPVAAEGKHETVKRLCTFINEIMRLAVGEGAIEFNPLSDITKLFPASQTQHFKTLKPEQLPELMKGMAIANLSRVTRCMFELQLHCATRPVEAATAKWEEFNLDTNIWTIPASKMKMNKPHQIPLSTQVIELLSLVKTMSGNKEYLFPSVKNPLSHANRETVNTAMKRNGFKNKIVSHGLRALFSTTVNEQGFDYDVIEAALAHIDNNKVRRAYNRSDYLERRRILMQWWSNHIQSASQGDMSMASGFQGLQIAS
jgi:integrase